jgi:GNAT superfamily N-acetyltransferase
MIKITFATAEDLPSLADLLTLLFTLEQDFAPQRESQLRGLRLILDDERIGKLFVLRVADKIVGMANALITISTAEGGRVLWLEDVIIVPDYRGQGLGSKLVEHVLAWAREQGMLRVTLLTDHDNLAAQHFYQTQGFQPSQMRVMRHALSLKNA